jgi:ketoreductase RED2
MRVVVNSAKNTTAGEALAAELPDAIHLQADVADPAAACRLVEQTVEHFGRLDVLINNAGTTRYVAHSDIEACDLGVWHEVFDVNLFGLWSVTSAAVPHLRASGAGVIINLSSVAGDRPSGSSIPYAVSKAAVNHLTEVLAKALGPEVRVNAIAPGHIDTPWYDGAPADLADDPEWTTRHSPLRRVGTPDDVAEAALGLLNAHYVTGVVLTVDGGVRLL